MALGKKVKLNELTEYELELIPKISEKLSKKIISYRRNLKRIEDLKKIKGIGEKTFRKIEKYVEVK